MKKSLIITIALMLFMVGVVFASDESTLAPPVPYLLNYQGMLTETDGTPLNGPIELTYKIYDVPSLGAALWSWTHTVQVQSGLFNDTLPVPSSYFNGPDRWLGITVTGGSELSPRTRLTSVAYAYTAEYALSAGSAPTGGGWVDAGATVSLQTSTDKVGIGTTSPDEKLTLPYNQYIGWEYSSGNSGVFHKIGKSSNGAGPLEFKTNFNAGPTGRIFSFIQENGGPFEHLSILYNGNVGIGTSDPGQKLSVIGDVGVGSSSQTGSLKVFLSGSANPVIVEQNYSNQGGSIRLYDETGNETHFIEADGNGSGGFFNVYRSTSAAGFTVDGNYSATNEPRVTINGSARDALFYMDQSGNSSVQLPLDAIYDAEILDEPGVASNKEGAAGITLDGTLQTLLSRSLTCPSSGYVLVIGTAQPQIGHVQGTTSSADFGVSASSSSLPDNQDMGLIIASGVPSGTFQYPVTVHGLFSVSSGSNTFYLLADKSTGSFTVYDRQLTLVFIPTAYGTVTATKLAGEQNIPDEEAPKVSSLSLSDIASEQAESEAFNSARIERELAEMRAQIEALKAEMGKQQGEQNR